MQETWVWSLRKIPWRRKWQPTPVFLPGESPWTEEASGLQSMGSQRVALSDWAATRTIPFESPWEKKIPPGGPFCLHPAASLWALLPSQLQQVHQRWDSAPVPALQWDGQPGRLSVCAALALCTQLLSHGLRDQCLTSSVPSSTVTRMLRHFSLLEHHDKKRRH